MTATNANQTTKKFDEQPRYEFLLTKDNHIICQRYFHIRDYNEDVLNSLELRTLLDTIAGTNVGPIGELGIIPKFLRDKSIDYLWSRYNPYVEQVEEIKEPINYKNDVFQFEIKVDGNSVAKTQFYGGIFPRKIRYAVDIKEITPIIISEIRYAFSQKKYTKVKPIVTAYDIYYNKVS